MNERIQELVEQSGISLYKKDVLDKHYPELYDGVYCESSVEQLEKFAELIVRECVEWCDAYATIDGTAQQIRDAIKNHFGVE